MYPVTSLNCGDQELDGKPLHVPAGVALSNFAAPYEDPVGHRGVMCRMLKAGRCPAKQHEVIANDFSRLEVDRYPKILTPVH